MSFSMDAGVVVLAYRVVCACGLGVGEGQGQQRERMDTYGDAIHNEELLEVPPHFVGNLARDSLLQVLVDRMRLLSFDVHLGHHRELDLIPAAGKFLNPVQSKVLGARCGKRH